MSDRLRRFWQEEHGQDMIEYTLLITFIAIACMWFVGAGGPTIRGVWSSANNTVNQASTTAAS